jgi:phage protein D
MKPIFKITADGTNITQAIRKNLVSLNLTDKRNLEADQLDITITDPKGDIALPRKGVEEQGLVYKGSFTADEISHQGPPDKIIIRARSANFSAGLKQEKDLSFHGQSIGQILDAIAKANNLGLAIEDKLKTIIIDHLDQTNESFANLITRLAKQYDALATIKNDTLLFIPVGHNKTVSGVTLPTIHINRKGCGRHTFVDADRETDYSGVKAKWHNLNTGQTKQELAGEEGNIKTLKETFPTQAEAAAAAKSKWQELSRGKKTMKFSRPVGMPEITPNMPTVLTGWKPEIDSVNWVTGDISHKLDQHGLSTDFQFEERK